MTPCNLPGYGPEELLSKNKKGIEVYKISKNATLNFTKDKYIQN